MDSLGRQLWETHWHLVCHRNELPLNGDFIKLQVLDEEVVVFNDQGDIVAFDNRCPHRGARMYTEASGNQAATCGYHGWTYAAGRVIVPRPEEFSQCDLATADLRRWQTDWIGDFLFVGKHPRQALDVQLGQTRPILEDISFGVAGRHDMNAYEFECDWRIALENALEPYHVPLIHPTSLGLLELDAGENQFFGANSIWYAKVGNARMARQLGTLKRFFTLDHQFEGYMSLYLFPFTMLSSTFGYSYSLQSFFPSVEPSRSHFTSRLLTMALRPGLDAGTMRSFFDSSAAVNRQVFDEDHRVCRRVPTDTWSAEPPRFSADSEQKLLHFRQSCREAIALQGS